MSSAASLGHTMDFLKEGVAHCTNEHCDAIMFFTDITGSLGGSATEYKCPWQYDHVDDEYSTD